MVATTETSRAELADAISIYGARGIKPPAMYAPAMVLALRTARLGSGGSRPNSKRIMKSIHWRGRCRRESTIGTASACVSP